MRHRPARPARAHRERGGGALSPKRQPTRASSPQPKRASSPQPKRASSPRRRVLGWAAFAVAAAGGAAVAWGGERKLLRRASLRDDPEWDELHRTLPSRQEDVVSFDGTRLAVQVGGRDEGPTIVFAHGYALSWRSWHYQWRDLADEFRLVAYDQRGHGASGNATSGDYSIAALGRDLAAVLDAFAPAGTPTVVVGHSMGGMTILSWAEHAAGDVAERIGGAVLVDTSGFDVIADAAISTGLAVLAGVEARVFQLGYSLLGHGLARPGTGGVSTDISAILTRLIGLHANASPAHVAFTEQMLIRCPHTVRAALAPALTSVDLRDATERLSVPSLVLVGTDDRLTPLASARKLCALLPDATLVELADTGHMAPLEAHASVTDEIRRFARDVLARERRRAG